MPAEGIDRNCIAHANSAAGALAGSRCRSTQGRAAEGIHFAFDRMERIAQHFDAHRLIWLAGQQGRKIRWGGVVPGLFSGRPRHRRPRGFDASRRRGRLNAADFLESGHGRQEGTRRGVVGAAAGNPRRPLSGSTAAPRRFRTQPPEAMQQPSVITN